MCIQNHMGVEVCRMVALAKDEEMWKEYTYTLHTDKHPQVVFLVGQNKLFLNSIC